VEDAMGDPYNLSNNPGKWLALSICSTMFCCTPLGIVGIVYAALAMSSEGRGDYHASYDQTNKAKNWTIWSFALGLLAIVILLCIGLTQDSNSTY
jgi:hypothetical protein